MMDVFDRRAVRLHRDRAAPLVGRIQPILADVAERLLDRLDDTTHRFTQALDVGGRGVVAPLLRARGIDCVSLDTSARMAGVAGGIAVAGVPQKAAVAGEADALPFAPGAFDLVVANLSLHWINDLPGALIQLRMALRPDGLLLASLPALGTLDAWRACLTQAEAMLSGGAAPRISPFPELADCAALLQRAGFALPVADADELELLYADPFDLPRDLRAAGETNASALRDRRTLPRDLLPASLAGMPVREGRMAVRLRLAMLTGWAPAASQPRPLLPGTGQVSLTTVFGTPDDP